MSSESRFSNTQAIISTLVATLGSGITFMPAIFNKFESLNSFLLMAFAGIITFISLYFIAFAADKSSSKFETKYYSFSYSGIAAKLSPFLSFCVSTALVLSSLSTSFSFAQTLMKLIIQTLGFNQFFATNVLLENIKMEDIGKYSEYFLPAFRLVLISTLTLVLYPLLKLENLNSLAIFSKLSLVCCIIFSFVTFIYGIISPYDFNNAPIEDLNAPKADFGGAIGLIFFALHCQFSLPDILSNVKDQSLKNFRNVLIYASILATLLYSAVGYFGYRAFGYAIGNSGLISAFGNKNSTLILSMSKRFGDIYGIYVPRFIHVAYIPIFFSGIVFNLFSIIPILQNLFSKGFEKFSRNKIAFMLSVFIFASGIKKIEDIDLLFGIIGFLFVAPLSFLFPAIFAFRYSDKFSLLRYASYIMIALSIAIIIGLSTSTVLQFVETRK